MPSESFEMALVAGDVAIVATDTVYGLASCVGAVGCDRIFELKRRPRDYSLPWLVADADALDLLADKVPSYAHDLARAYWPGALTLVVFASEAARKIGAVAPDGTVALRCPDYEDLLSLMRRLNTPLACTSANLHGEQSVWRKCDIDESFRMLPGFDALPDECPGHVASTVIDCTKAELRVLRQGDITV